MMISVFPAGPVETNAYILACNDTKKAWIIDAPKGCAAELISEINLEGLSVEKIVLTHSHWDHIADVAELKKKFGCPVVVHREDAGNVEHPGSDGLSLYFPIDGVVPDQILEGTEILTLGNMQIQVIHTPGHSPGCICLYIPEEKTLISGDTLFRGCMGRVDLPTSEPSRMWESLRVLSNLPGDTKVYPGHGGSTSIAQESWIKDSKERFAKERFA